MQGAGSRLAFSYARDGALPGSRWMARVHPRFRTPTNALLAGAVVTMLFVLLVFYSPAQDVHLGFITYPANINALVALVSFGVSGIYLSFLLTVIGAMVARARGWVPEGRFRLGRWGWTVCIVAAAYLALMLLNVVAPTGLTSPRGYFNLDWITLLVMVIVAVVGVVLFLSAGPTAPSARTCTTRSSRPARSGTTPPGCRQWSGSWSGDLDRDNVARSGGTASSLRASPTRRRPWSTRHAPCRDRCLARAVQR